MSKTTKLEGKTILLHGPPKVGKTQLAASFPKDVLFIATERGHRFLPDHCDVASLTAGADGWSEFIELLGSDLSSYKTVVVDTIGQLYDFCMEAVCKENKWDHPQDAGHGKGWAAVKRDFSRKIAALVDVCDKCKQTLIWIDHTKLEQITGGFKEYHKLMIASPGQARSVIVAAPDHIWYLGYGTNEGKDAVKDTSGSRTLFLGGSDHIEAGTRDDTISIDRIEDLPKYNQYDYIVKHLED